MRMQRQKVKGTGHKQPADAQTEPNFYQMTPSREQPPSPERSFSAPHQEVPQLSVGSTMSSLSYDEMSPGLRGVHGAAHLLKNIAAGIPASSISTPFSLGLSATAASVQKTQPESSEVADSNPAAPKGPGDSSSVSLSLLGRVNCAESGGSSTQTQEAGSSSIFHWPPLRPSPASSSLTPKTAAPRSLVESSSSEIREREGKEEPGDGKKLRVPESRRHEPQSAKDIGNEKESSHPDPTPTGILPSTPPEKRYSKGEEIENESKLRETLGRCINKETADAVSTLPLQTPFDRRKVSEEDNTSPQGDRLKGHDEREKLHHVTKLENKGIETEEA